MNYFRLRNLKSILFYVMLFASLASISPKAMATKPELGDFDVSNKFKCYIGSPSQLIAMIDDVVHKFDNKAVDDSEAATLVAFAKSLSEFKFKKASGTATSDDANEIFNTYKDFIIVRFGTDVLEQLPFSINLGDEEFAGYIDSISSTYDKVAEQITISEERPFYFKEDLLRSISYTEKSLELSLIEDKDSCVPAKSLYDFDDLAGDLNFESLPIEPLGSDTYNINSEVLGDGRVSLAFWVKISLSNVRKGKTSIFSYTAGSNVINLSLEEGQDGKTVNFNFKVGQKSIVLTNPAQCSDLAQIHFYIYKEYKEYYVRIIVRSTINADRQVATIYVPTEYIEFGTFNFPNSSLVSVDSIFKILPSLDDRNIKIIQEIEISTQITTDKIKLLQTILQEQCQARPPCEYINAGDCSQCELGHFLYGNECVTECPIGFYPDDGSICQPCNLKCKTCDNANTCLTCNEGEFLLDGNCISTCPAGTYPNNGKCETCKGDCELCTTEDSCIKCKNGFLNDDKCVEACPIGFYSSFNPNKCLKCCKKCVECLKEHSCTSCIEGLFLLGDRCIKVCPNGKFANDGNNTCEDCSLHCDTCTSLDNCTICASGFSLEDGSCVSDCPKGSISLNGVCIHCEKNCNVCLARDITTCTECRDGYYLKNGDCVDDCGIKMFVDDLNSCKDCPKNCDVCDSPNVCKTCSIGFFLYQGECVDVCPNGYVGSGKDCVLCDPESKCKSCCSKDNSKCLTCFEGTFLNEGKCVEVCPVGTYVDGKLCKPCNEDCVSCSNGLTCDECKDPKFFKDGVCVDSCGDGYTSVSSACHPCQITDCSDCTVDISKCNKCKKPLFLLNGLCINFCPKGTVGNKDNECVPCITNCAACTEENKCNSCIDPFVLLSDKTCGDKCPDGETNINGECVKCSNPRCKECTADLETCISCPDLQYLYNNDCYTECPLSTFASGNNCLDCQLPCKTCFEEATKCTDCPDTFSFDNNTCLSKCPDGKTDVNGDCQNCGDENCKICNSVDVCDQCLDGKFLFEGKCYSVCPEAYFPQDGICKPCSSNCKSCSDSQICLVCKDDFSLFQNICVENCPIGYVSVTSIVGKICEECGDHCDKCYSTNTSSCEECEVGAFLINGICVPICPSGNLSDIDSKKCLPCTVEKCDKCNPVDICLSCKDGEFLLDNTCLDKCPKGTRAIGLKCEKCNVEFCSDCVASLDTCEKCDDDKFKLSDTSCVKDCPEQYYTDLTSKTCQLCPTSCQTCTDTHTCQSCKNGYFLYENDCIETCPDGYVEVPDTKKCEKCPANCKECLALNTDICEECKSGFPLQDTACADDCDVGRFLNEQKNRCDTCPTTCISCTSADNCTECVAGLSLNDGECVDNCPELFAKVNGRCVPCQTSVNCLKCDATQLDICIDCGNLILFEGRCIDSCPAGYRRLNNNTCEKCIDNCKICSNELTCEECINPFVLLTNGICDMKCPEGYVSVEFKCEKCNDDNCLVCKSDKECTICQPDYFLKISDTIKSCVKNCGEGYYPEDGKCKSCNDLNCIDCTNSNNCFDCNNDLFLLNNSECVHTCPKGKTPVDDICVDCEAGCERCSQEIVGVCFECKSPKVLFNQDCLDQCPDRYTELNSNPGNCDLCTDNCLVCSNKDEKNCLVCETGYFIAPDNTCVIKCPEGFAAVEGRCEACIVPECSNCDASISVCKFCIPPKVLDITAQTCAESCNSDEYILEGKCVKCNNCPVCTNETGKCTLCYEGFFLTTEGVCHSNCGESQIKVGDECLPCNVDGCKICPTVDSCVECKDPLAVFENKCVENCPSKTYLNGKICDYCSENCKTCEKSDLCTECLSPFVLQGTLCQNECNYGFANVNGICKECHHSERCLECKADSLDKCTQCKLGFYLKDDICVDNCGSNFFVESTNEGDICSPCKDNCKSCTDPFSCDRCDKPFLLENNNCVENCDEGYVQVGEECKKCTNSLCALCSVNDQSICDKCKEGYVLKNNECTDNCGSGYYVDENKVCQECSVKNCLTCSNQGTKCEDCKDGFFILNGLCVSSCPVGYVANSSDVCIKCNDGKCKICELIDLNICVVCETGFLFNGECVDICPQGYYGKDHVCSPCTFQCLECTSDSDCTLCRSPYTLNDNSCITHCPEKTVEVEGKCLKCDSANCIVCEANLTSCTVCSTPFLLLNLECVEECPTGYFSTGTSCEQCEKSCDKCSNSSECRKCDDSTYLFKGDCYTKCPDYTYANEDTRKCEFCNDDEKCIKCNPTNPSECEKCNSSILYGAKCIDKCPDGTYYDKEIDSCSECNPNCELCASKDTCDKCKADLVLLDSQCLTSCPDKYVKVGNICKQCAPDCLNCSPTNLDECKSCDSPLILYDGACLETCPLTTFKTTNDKGQEICSQCGSNCTVCNSFKDCTDCNPGFNVLEGKCVDNCPTSYVEVDDICKECSDNHCLVCSEVDVSICKECETGLYLKEGKCVQDCGVGFFTNIENMACVECDITCKECNNALECTVCQNQLFFIEGTFHCDTCKTPFLVVGDQCKSCKAANCELCIDDDQTCKICSGTYVLVDGICKENCPISTYKSGQECKNCGSGCLTCESTEKCNICEGLKVLLNGECIESCPAGYGLNEKRECLPCTVSNCEKCDTSIEICDLCPSNFTLSKNKCVEKCPEGTFKDGKKCEDCPSFCLSCDDAVTCRVCQDKYYLKNDQCTNDCGPGYYADKSTGQCYECGTKDCKDCDSTKCKECLIGYYLFENNCVLQCPEGYFKKEGECKSCSAGCSQCINEDTCIICQEGLVILDDKCVANCPLGTTKVNGRCESCLDKTCEICSINAPANCEKCSNGYLVENTCVSVCPKGYYPDEIKKECIACDFKCTACISSTECTECKQEFALVGTECTNKCPEGSYFHIGKCNECNIDDCKNCALENSAPICIECKTKNLFDGICIEICPKGSFSENLKCVPCPSTCLECVNNEICTLCKPNIFMLEGKCLTGCTDGYFPECSDPLRCTKCDEACVTCTGSTNKKCLTCSEGYTLIGTTCDKNLICEDGTYKNTALGVCESCQIPHCNICSDAETCTSCNRGFELKDRFCLSNGSIETVYDGITLQSPFSINYNIQHEIQLNQYETFNKAANTLSILAWIRDLGTRFTLNQSDESTIYSFSTDQIIISLTVKKSDDLCIIKVTKDQNTIVIDTGVDCSSANFFKWNLLVLSIYPTSIVEYKFVLFINGDAGKAGYISFPKGFDILNETGKLTLIDQNTASSLGSQIAKINVANYKINSEVVEKFNQHYPQGTSWLCDKDSPICTTGFIPVQNKFSELNTKYKLIDIAKLNQYETAYKTFGTTFLFYPEKISGSSYFITRIYYEYKSSNIKETNALSLFVNASITAPTATHNNIQIPAGLLKEKEWVYIYVGIASEVDSVTYKVEIKNSSVTQDILVWQIDVPTEIKQTTKLFIDATVVYGDSSVSGQTYNPVIFLGGDKIPYVPIEDLTGIKTCAHFIRDMKCEVCLEYYVFDQAGLCVDNAINLGEKIFNLINAYNLYEEKVNIPDKYKNKDFTIVFTLRKLAHSSVDQESNIEHEILRFGNENLLNSIIREKAFYDFTSIINFGKEDIKVDYGDVSYPFTNVVLAYTKKTKSVKFMTSIDGVTYTSVQSVEGEFNTLLFFDKVGIEIHFEAINGFIYPKALIDQDLITLVNRVLVPADPVCQESDLTTGKCLKCANKSVSEYKCSTALYGLSFFQFFGAELLNNLKNDFEVKTELKNSVNSSFYAITTRFKLYKLQDIDFKTNGLYSILTLSNDVHLDYHAQNPSSVLLNVSVEVQNGNPLLSLTSGNSIRWNKIYPKDFKLQYNTWVFITLAIDTNTRLLTYYVTSDNYKDTDSIQIFGIPEKLQNVGKLQILDKELISDYGNISCYLEQINSFIIPNPPTDLPKLISLLENTDKYKPVIPKDILNCKYTTYDVIKKISTCLLCNTGFTLSTGICIKVPPRANGYQVINEIGGIMRGLNNYKLTYPFNKDEFIFAAFFRMNHFVSDLITILKTDTFEMKVKVENIGNTYLYFNNNQIGPFDPSKFKNWNTIYIAITKKDMRVCLKSCLFTDYSDDNCYKSTNPVGLPSQLIIDNSSFNIQVTGEQVLQYDYLIPAIDYCGLNNCPTNCNACKDGVCLSTNSDFNTDGQTISYNLVDLPFKSAPTFFNSLLDYNKELLRSDVYSFRFVYYSKFSPDNEELYKISLGSTDSFLKLTRVSKNNYSLSFSSFFIKNVQGNPIETVLTLPDESKNDKIIFIFSVRMNGAIHAFMYDSKDNFINIVIFVKGNLGYLTNTATITYNQNVHDFKISYSNFIPLIKFVAMAQQMASTEQASCIYNENANFLCTQCARGYKTGTSSVLNKQACVLNTDYVQSFSNILQKIKAGQSSNTIKFQGDTTTRPSKLESFAYMTGLYIRYPNDLLINEENLFTIKADNDLVIITVNAIGNGIMINNLETGKSIIIADIVSLDNRVVRISFVINFEFASGTTSAFILNHETNSVVNGQSKGKSREYNASNLNNLTVEYGSGRTEKSLIDIRYKGADLYFNHDLTNENLKDLSLMQDDEVEVSGQSLSSSKASLKPNDYLLTRVGDLANLKNINSYRIDLKIDNSNPINNGDVLYLITNSYSNEDLALSQRDILPLVLATESILNVTVDKNVLKLTVRGITSFHSYNLLPPSIEDPRLGFASFFKNINIQIQIDNELKRLSILIIADNVYFRQVIKENDLALEALNARSIVHFNGKTSSTELNVHAAPFHNIINKDNLKVEKTNLCTKATTGCLICEISLVSNSCTQCQPGYVLNKGLQCVESFIKIAKTLLA